MPRWSIKTSAVAAAVAAIWWLRRRRLLGSRSCLMLAAAAKRRRAGSTTQGCHHAQMHNVPLRFRADAEMATYTHNAVAYISGTFEGRAPVCTGNLFTPPEPLKGAKCPTHRILAVSAVAPFTFRTQRPGSRSGSCRPALLAPAGRSSASVRCGAPRPLLVGKPAFAA